MTKYRINDEGILFSNNPVVVDISLTTRFSDYTTVRFW